MSLFWQQVTDEPERQTWSCAQQNGSRPGPTRWPGLVSAILPGGQHRFGFGMCRGLGQHVRVESGVRPMLPAVICGAHFVFGGQQVRLPPTVQQSRPLRQQRLLAQQRSVALLQHFVPHSSWLVLQRLHNPVLGLAQRQFVGQHLPVPQRARPCGHLGRHTAAENMPTRPMMHSSFGLQHAVLPQHSWPSGQQFAPHLGPTHSQVRSPGWPHR